MASTVSVRVSWERMHCRELGESDYLVVHEKQNVAIAELSHRSDLLQMAELGDLASSGQIVSGGCLRHRLRVDVHLFHCIRVRHH